MTAVLRWRYGTVTTLRRQWRGSSEVDVSIESRDASDPATARALAYIDIVGRPQLGDQVLLNCNAQSKGLGTGGYALVVAIPQRLPEDVDSPGHVVKARYTAQQTMSLAVDEEASPYRHIMESVEDIDGMPVVIADLHSALPAIVAGITADNSQARIAYVMTDGGALPAWFSRTLHDLSDQLVGTVTVGQSFGGDLEATNIHTGLLAARHVLDAQFAVVAQGPGNLGTGTQWGFSGTASGDAINAVAALAGKPIGALRISSADPRKRHFGVSHHNLTAYGKVALSAADLPVPDSLEPEISGVVNEQLHELSTRHRIVRVSADRLITAMREQPVSLSTMGRDLDADLSYFLSCAVAGRHAVAVS